MKRDMDAPALRVPPHSVEAEQSVLGGLLMEPAAYSRVSDLLTAGDFYRHEHKVIFDALADMAADGAEIDLVTVFERLKANTTAEHVGGLAYLNSLLQSVPSAANVRRHAEIVVEHALLRQVIAQADDVASEAFNPKDRTAADIAGDWLKRLRTVADSTTRAERFPILGPSQLAALPPQQWLVKHMIPSESVGVVYGGSGAFKTFIALDLALHICHGRQWLGQRTVAGDVLMIVGEGAGGIKKRIDAWHIAHHADLGKSRLFVLPLAVDVLADAGRVADAAESLGIKAALVVVDTMSQTFRGEENSANEVAAYLGALGAAFRDRWKASVMVIHHTGHQHERPRGSSTLRNNSDFLFGVFRDKHEMLATVGCDKQKDGAEPDDVSFQLRAVGLDMDDDGEPVSGLAAFHVRTAAELRQIVAHDAEQGRKGYHAKLIDLARDGQKERELRQAFYDACEHLGSVDSKSKAFRRAMQWASNSQLLAIVDGEVRIYGRL